MIFSGAIRRSHRSLGNKGRTCRDVIAIKTNFHSKTNFLPHLFISLKKNYRKDVRLPIQLQRAMAAEAEASREARAKVIAAEGEQKASRALREASEVIGDSPAALQLRYLQVCLKWLFYSKIF